MTARNKDNKETTQQNISYYNEIAGNYNQLMAKQDYNARIRQKVKEKMLQLAKPGWVLDFGGGTGLDLAWLIASGYKVIFCEPSSGMRQQAIVANGSAAQRNEVIFLQNDLTDFHTWNKTLPFTQTTEAILANFCVLNNINDLECLFKNFAPLVKPGGHFVALVLEHRFKKMWQWHRRNALRTLVTHKPFVMYTWNGSHKQVVFVHSISDIKKAAAPYFDYRSHEALQGFGFTLIHLTRK